MKIMEDKLKQLEKENEDDFFRIRSEERRKEVSRMIKYISSSSLPLYQIQIIRKDLLGMAQEAERQELPLKDMLGVEPREFCDEIIENAATPARKERAFQLVIDVLQPFDFYVDLRRDAFQIRDYADGYHCIPGIVRYLQRLDALYGQSAGDQRQSYPESAALSVFCLYGSSDRHRRAFRFRLCGRNVCDIRPRPFHGHPGGCDCHRSDAFMEPVLE